MDPNNIMLGASQPTTPTMQQSSAGGAPRIRGRTSIVGSPSAPSSSAASAILPTDLQWATVAEQTTKDIAAIKDVCFDASTGKLYCSQRSGIFRWSWEAGRLESVMPTDKIGNGDLVYAVLPIGSLLWSSIGKGKVYIYDMAEERMITKFIAHSGEIVCMTAISEAGDARVLTGGMDFLVKLWDKDGILVSQSAHHHGTVRCALQIDPNDAAKDVPPTTSKGGKCDGGDDATDGGDRRPSQIWTGSDDGSVFRWIDRDANGKVNKDEGTTMKHSSSEGITALHQEGAYVWAGTEKGKLAMWLLEPDEGASGAGGYDGGLGGAGGGGDARGRGPACEITGAHRDRITSIASMGDATWTSGSDKTICAWDNRRLPNQPTLLYTFSESIGYVKRMVSVDWAVWVFHSKGLAIYAAASTLGEAQGRCEGLQAALGEWQAKAGGLEEALEAQCTAQESLEYQLTTVQDRHAEASEKIKAMQTTVDGMKTEVAAAEDARAEAVRTAASDAEASTHALEELRAELAESEKKSTAAIAEARGEAAEVRAKAQADVASTERTQAEARATIERELGETIAKLRSDLASRDAALASKEAELQSKEEALAQAEASGRDLEYKLSEERMDRNEERNAIADKHDSMLKALREEGQRAKEAFEAAVKERDGMASSLEGEVARLREDLEASTKAMGELEVRESECRDELGRLGSVVSDKEAALAAKDTEIRHLTGRIQEMKESASKNIDDLKREFADQGQEQSRSYGDTLERLAKEKEEIETRLSERIKALEQTKTHLEQTQTQLEAKWEAEREALRGAQGDLEERIRESSDRLAEAQREGAERLAQVQRDLDASREERQRDLDASDKAREGSQAQWDEEKAALVSQVQDLRSRHAKSLLMAGGKQQEMLARHKKALEDKQRMYDDMVQAKTVEMSEMRRMQNQQASSHEEKIRAWEDAKAAADEEARARSDELSRQIKESARALEDARDQGTQAREAMEAMRREAEDRVQEMLAAHKQELNRVNAELEGKKLEMQDTISAYREKVEHHEEECLRLSGLLRASEKELKNVTQTSEAMKDNLLQTRRMLEDQLEECMRKASTAEEQLAAMQEATQRERENASRLHAAEMVSLKTEVDNQRAQAQNALAELNGVRSTLADLQQKFSRMQKDREAEKENMISAHKRDMDDMTALVDDVSRQAGAVQSTATAYESKLRDLEDRYLNVRSLFEESQRSLIEIQQENERDMRTMMESSKAEYVRIMEEKASLERRVEAFGRDAEAMASKEEALRVQIQSLQDSLQGAGQREAHAATEKERIYMELEDVQSLMQTSGSGNAIARSRVYSAGDIQLPIYVRNLKQDIFTLVSNLNRDILDLKHREDMQKKSIDDATAQSTKQLRDAETQRADVEGLLDKKRKKKRKWKTAYLRLSASQAEEVNALQSQVHEANAKVKTQMGLYQKSQQALRHAAYQLHHAKELEGALDQAQGEYANLLTRLGEARQQAEKEKRASQDRISKLKAELEVQNAHYEETTAAMISEIGQLRRVVEKHERDTQEQGLLRQQKAQQQQQQQQRRYQQEQAALQTHGDENESNRKRGRNRERYSGFVC